ncbi:hypothetical protein BC827DRAFT_742924 [Russula dissimulans]|nr:hypothetical protein BC827DRAFT_742924 [Russula dissimulans]
MGNEAYNDYKRDLRDHAANSARYPPQTTTICHTTLLVDSLPPTCAVPSSSIRVGDLVLLEKNQRVPADLVLRKDKLDDETDWKLRVAVPETQKLPSNQELLNPDAEIYADAPTNGIDSFIGTFTINIPFGVSSNEVPMVRLLIVKPLSVEVLCANTVVAEGSAIDFVDCTGPEARGVMKTSHPETKVVVLDLEISQLAEVRRSSAFLDVRVLMVVFCAGCTEWVPWIVVYLGVPLLDFILVNYPYQVGICVNESEESTLSLRSLRVNHMGKTVYAHLMIKDKSILGTIMRTSTLPGKLGRIESSQQQNGHFDSECAQCRLGVIR